MASSSGGAEGTRRKAKATVRDRRRPPDGPARWQIVLAQQAEELRQRALSRDAAGRPLTVGHVVELTAMDDVSQLAQHAGDAPQLAHALTCLPKKRIRLTKKTPDPSKKPPTMQQTLPDGPLDAWFMVAEQILRCGDRSLLGGWVRVWIGNPFEIHAMACVSKAFKPFLFPVCQSCKRRWTYRRHFSHIYFMPMCRERIARANTCFNCHTDHPCISPYPIVDGRPDRSGPALWALWRTQCVQCGLYICSHPQVVRVSDIESPLSPSQPSWRSSVTSIIDCGDSWSDLLD